MMQAAEKRILIFLENADISWVFDQIEKIASALSFKSLTLQVQLSFLIYDV